jgi:uncharacterized protein with FMN-binding domain
VASTSVLGLLSIAGGFGINLWLNPQLASSSVNANNAQPQTVESDTLQYRYGIVHLKITAKSGALTEVDILDSSATPGFEQAYPLLTEAALSANGSNFENVSGATFTTEAFKEALNNAIGKLG